MHKLNKLKKIIREMGSVLIAFSGGADSSLLLKISKDVLKDNILAVTAISATYPVQELKSAREFAAGLGLRHKIIRTTELNNPKFLSNPINRCYYCKKELFARLKKIAARDKINFVADASNVSDIADFRPGDKAKKESGVRSPFIEAGFTKQDVRSISRKLALTTWNKPSLACLASRIPYGSRISPDILSRINKAELFLNSLGFKQVRLRHYGNLCRIEVPQSGIKRLLSLNKDVVDKFKKLGYNYVTVDLEGFRSGSMNEVFNR